MFCWLAGLLLVVSYHTIYFYAKINKVFLLLLLLLLLVYLIVTDKSVVCQCELCYFVVLSHTRKTKSREEKYIFLFMFFYYPSFRKKEGKSCVCGVSRIVYKIILSAILWWYKIWKKIFKQWYIPIRFSLAHRQAQRVNIESDMRIFLLLFWDTYSMGHKEKAAIQRQKRCHSRHVYDYLHSCCENQNYTQSINEQFSFLFFFLCFSF